MLGNLKKYLIVFFWSNLLLSYDNLPYNIIVISPTEQSNNIFYQKIINISENFFKLTECQISYSSKILISYYQNLKTNYLIRCYLVDKNQIIFHLYFSDKFLTDIEISEGLIEVLLIRVSYNFFQNHLIISSPNHCEKIFLNNKFYIPYFLIQGMALLSLPNEIKNYSSHFYYIHNIRNIKKILYEINKPKYNSEFNLFFRWISAIFIQSFFELYGSSLFQKWREEEMITAFLENEEKEEQLINYKIKQDTFMNVNWILLNQKCEQMMHYFQTDSQKYSFYFNINESIAQYEFLTHLQQNSSRELEKSWKKFLLHTNPLISRGIDRLDINNFSKLLLNSVSRIKKFTNEAHAIDFLLDKYEKKLVFYKSDFFLFSDEREWYSNEKIGIYLDFFQKQCQ